MPIDLPTELAELRQSILSMGAAVVQRTNMAIRGVLEEDLDAAGFVRQGDDEIDRMEMNIENECLRILALSQPVAGDLRFVLAVMRINGELERVGDLARSIAKRAIDLATLDAVDFPNGLQTMAEETCAMLSSALAALEDSEPALARRTRLTDDRVDDLLKEIFAWAQESIPQHVERTAAILDILTVARKLERIADLSTNIAENVIFLTEGTLVRHPQVR